MTAAIIVHISPDESDPTRCGECYGPYLDINGDCGWMEYVETADCAFTATRGPECLRAEKLIADLREAGTAMRDQLYDYNGARREQVIRLVGAWNDALAAIDAAGKAAR